METVHTEPHNRDQNTDPNATWVHCAGKDNPANLPSRGMSLAQLTASDLWRKGLDWLTNGELSVCQEDESMP